ncbi:MAG TPA: hypothetical protein VE441_08315 [Mycobacterium sp.]|nr:hypothetical protein [Mycobacterium sp.]
MIGCASDHRAKPDKSQFESAAIRKSRRSSSVAPGSPHHSTPKPGFERVGQTSTATEALANLP